MSSRTDGLTVIQLRDLAKRMFPGKTRTICLTSKDDLIRAINTNHLPDVAASPSPVTRTNTVPTTGNDAATQIAMAIETLTSQFTRPVSEDEVELIARGVARDVFCSMMQSAKPAKELTIRVNDLPAVSIDGQHERFPYLLAICAARVNVMMIGPAGSGKTSAAHAVANALGLQFRAMSVGPQTSKADLLGFKNAMGEYQTTPLREMYVNGGVFLLDELDAGNPGVLTVLNALLANGEMIFGDGIPVKKHPDFICLAAANTFGTGASREYVGRQALDSATLDRFFTLEWNYDETFEAALLGLQVTRNYVTLQKSGYTVQTWFSRVTSLRHAAEDVKARHMISPRATFGGAKLLDVLPKNILEDGLLWKGCTELVKRQIEGAV